MHQEASLFADHILHKLELSDRLSREDGRAELAWDLAYDAFMYRSLPSLPLFPLPHGPLPRGSLCLVRDGVEL